MSHEWISITEAAARLTAAGDRVERSTLSRYIKQHAEALETRRTGRETQVEFGALVQHRRENVRLARSGDGLPPAMVVVEEGRRGAAAPAAGTQAAATARKIGAEAELKEMEVAARRGELTPVAEVDRGSRDAVALMQSAFDRAVETTAAELSVKYGWDERAVRLALKGFAKSGLEAFHTEMLSRLDDLRRRREGGDDRPTAGTPEATLQ